MTAPTPGGALFTTGAVDALAYWQAQNMPDRAFVFTRELARLAGAVLHERYVFNRVDPCRLSLSRASERDNVGTRTESHSAVLARPVTALPFEGSERVVVLGRVAPTFVRVVAEQRARTFQTVRKADVTEDGVERFVLATTRARGPVALRYAVTITIGNP